MLLLFYGQIFGMCTCIVIRDLINYTQFFFELATNISSIHSLKVRSIIIWLHYCVILFESSFWPSIYSIISTFGTDKQTNLDLVLQKRKYKVKVGLSVQNVDFIHFNLGIFKTSSSYMDSYMFVLFHFSW